MISEIESTTDSVVAIPTPAAPRVTEKPLKPLLTTTTHPNTTVFPKPIKKSDNSTTDNISL